MVKIDRHRTAAPGRLAARSRDHQIIGAFLDLHAGGGKPPRHGGQAVAFLDAQFLQPLHAGFALGQGRGDGEDRVFVDHRGGALRRNGDALERPGRDTQVRDRLSRFLARTQHLDLGPHFAQRRQDTGTQRIEADVLQRNVRARHQQRRDQGKGGGRNIGRHGDVAGNQFGPADQ